MTFLPRPKKNQRIYLDHAAATPVDKRVLSAMMSYFSTVYANPSSLYTEAVAAKKAVEDARAHVADILGTEPDTIMFTSGATESINLALQGIIRIYETQNKQPHIITTRIEHPAVLETIRFLEKHTCDVTYLPVNTEGLVSLDQFKKALRSETILVSIMYANNEIGTIQPMGDIGREIMRWRKSHQTLYPLFHTDSSQACASEDLHVDRLHTDLMSFGASKMYGPKGAGVLYKRRGVTIEPMVHGGGQENQLRSGTENVPGVVGTATALGIVFKEREKENKRLRKLRDYFWKQIQKTIPDAVLNGPGLPEKKGDTRLPNNINIVFPGTVGEVVVLYLDAEGIACSSAAACSTKDSEASHVLTACGRSRDEADASVRFTLGRCTTKKEIDYTIKQLQMIIPKARKMKKMEM